MQRNEATEATEAGSEDDGWAYTEQGSGSPKWIFRLNARASGVAPHSASGDFLENGDAGSSRNARAFTAPRLHRFPVLLEPNKEVA